MTHNPLLSIITVVYNSRTGLEKTIRSVIEQNIEEKEFIVIDGGSTDGTLDIIDRYKDHIDFWSSEPDNGIYEAMNKGVAHSNGDFLHFLNSGDTYYSSNSLLIALKILRSTRYTFYKFSYEKSGIFTERLSLFFLLRYMLNHQSIIYHKSLFDQYRYDPSQKFAADYAHLLNIYSVIEIGYFDFPLIIFDENYSSQNRKVISTIWKERAMGLLKSHGISAAYRIPAAVMAFTMAAIRKIIY